MRTLALQLVGITPLLLHNISRHQLREQIASKKGTSMTLKEEAFDVMLKDKNVNPAVDIDWLWDAIRAGCSRVVVDKQQVSFFKIESCLHLPTDLILLKDTDNHVPVWESYSSLQHASPRSKKSIVVVAPMFKDWMIALSIQLQTNIPIHSGLENEELLKKVFVEAGRVGIGLFHPPKKHFGQFRPVI